MSAEIINNMNYKVIYDGVYSHILKTDDEVNETLDVFLNLKLAKEAIAI